MEYEPKPFDTSRVELTGDILKLSELLAKNTHDNWAAQRFSEGWRYGSNRDDGKKEHPSLVPYEDLSDTEKQYDRLTSMETLKAIISLGYKIEKV